MYPIPAISSGTQYGGVVTAQQAAFAAAMTAQIQAAVGTRRSSRAAGASRPGVPPVGRAGPLAA